MNFGNTKNGDTPNQVCNLFATDSNRSFTLTSQMPVDKGERKMNSTRKDNFIKNKERISNKKTERRKSAGVFKSLYHAVWLVIVAAAMFSHAGAQNIPYSDNKADQTLRSNGRVNPSTLGLEISIPLASYPGRAGLSVPVALNYSSKVWRMDNKGLQPRVNNPNCYSHLQAKYGEYSASGWTSSLGLAYVEYTGETDLYDENGKPLIMSGNSGCYDTVQNQANYVKRILVHLPSGEAHELRASDEPVIRERTSTTPIDMTGTYYSVDGSKMKYVEDGNGTYRLYMPDGSYYDFAATRAALDQKYVRMGTLYKDLSGNQLTFNAADSNNPNGSWTDSIGRTISVPLSPTAAPASATVQNYQLPGITNPYKLYWKQLKGSTAAESGLTDFNQSLRYTGSFTGFGQTSHTSSEILFQNASAAWVYSGSNPVFNPIVLTAVELPNGSKYQFSYNIYGEIERIIYPTGGEEHLTLGPVAPIDPITDDSSTALPYLQANRGVTQRGVYENASATPSVWTYSTGVINNPDGTRTERVMLYSDPCTGCEAGDFGFGFVLSGMPTEERTYSASNQLLAKKLTTWTKTEFAVNGGNKNAEWHPRPTKEETIIYNPATSTALSSTTTMEYAGNLSTIDNPLNVSKTNQYSFTTSLGSLGSLEKSVETDYLSDGTYNSLNLKSLPIETRVKDAAGSVKAKSQISYDEGGYGSGGAKGQPTTARSWTDVANNQYVEAHSKYDSYGNLTEAIDAKGNITTTEYDATYHAYPTKVTSPVPDSTGANGSSTAFETTSTYDATTGLVLTTTDANGQTTSMEYNDSMLRPTKVIPPSSAGQTVMEYTDTPGSVAVKTKTQIDSTNWAESTVYADGLGRAIKSEKKDNSGNVFTETQYDAMGRVWKTSNPYRTGDTKLWTETTYDDLSRVVKVKTPDNAEVNTAFDLATSGTLGTVVTSTDAAGKKGRAVTNALGELVRVDEPDDSNNLGTLSSPNQATSYLYDTLGKMVKVTQGAQSRFFKYDSLGRLLRVRQPEQGVNSNLALTDAATGNSDWSAGFTYDANGNLLTATDTKGVVITSAYDNINRVVSRSYSDSTPAVSFKYDDPNIQYSKGKLTRSANSVSASQILSLDNTGKVLSGRQTTDGNNYDSSYTYNLAGGLLEETYPSGRKVKNTLATDGNLSKIETQISGGSWNTRADNFAYAAHGAIAQLQIGSGKWENAQFNSRLQVTQLALGTSATDTSLWKLNYDFGSTDNNGNVKSQTTTVPGLSPLVQTYTYDSLSRLKSAEEISNNQQTFKQTFVYDRYGNRNFDASNTTTLGSCPANQCNPSFDQNTNRITSAGYTYDLAGNVIADAQGRQFTFNGDNKQTEVKDASNNVIGTYYYDGDGKRIKKVTAQENTTFVYSGGKLVAEYQLTTATPQTPTTQYITTDMLGSPRVISDGSGNIVSRRDFMPFGEEVNNLGGRSTSVGYNGDTIRQKFTGYQRDDETNLDFAEARYYNSQNGRFTAVDPLLASGKSANPQSFNRYVYVGNNPLERVDPDGTTWYKAVEVHVRRNGTSYKTAKPYWSDKTLAGKPVWDRGSVYRATASGRGSGKYVSLNPWANEAALSDTRAAAEAKYNAYKSQMKQDLVGSSVLAVADNADAVSPGTGGFNVNRRIASALLNSLGINPNESSDVSRVSSRATNSAIIIASTVGGEAVPALAEGKGVNTVKEGSFFDGTRYTEKVLIDMNKGDLHSFPESVKAFEDLGTVKSVTSGDGVTGRQMLEIPGGYKNYDNGVFQFMKEPNGDINHRLFKRY